MAALIVALVLESLVLLGCFGAWLYYRSKQEPDMLPYLKSLNAEVAALVASLQQAVELTQKLIDLQKQLNDPIVGVNVKLD